MPDYANGKIYKIVDNTNNNVYIGSTCKTLKLRLSGHVSHYKRYLKGKHNYITSFDIFKNDDYEILLVESFPCDYKDELLARERYWTNKILCINKYKPGLFNELGRVEWKKQYNIEHQDHLKQYKKQYKAENQEQINEKNKQYYVEHQDHIKKRGKQYYADHKDSFNEKQYCKCGGMYTLTHKSRHMKSIKHIEYLKSETIKQSLFKNLSFDEIYQKYKTL